MKTIKINHLLAAAALAALPIAGLIGCDKSEPTPDSPAAANKQMDRDKASGEDVKDKMQNTVEDTKDAATDSADKAKEMAADAKDNAGGMTSMAADQASTMLKQVQTFIDDKKYDMADSTLKKVEGMESNMPEAMKSQISNLRQSLNTAMAASEKAMENGAGK